MNKFNIKTAFAIILIIIFVIGAYLLFKSPKPGTSTTNVGDKGFLSFFGNRDTKPVDETTVPGAKSGNKNNTGDLQTGGNTNGTGTDGNDNNGGSNGNNSNGNGSGGNNTGGSNGNGSSGNNNNGTGTGNANGNGSLSIKSIGTNPNNNGGGSNGTGGVGSGTNGNGSTGGNSGSSAGGFNGGGSNGNGGNPGGNTGSSNGGGTGGTNGSTNGNGGSNGTGGTNVNPNDPKTFVTTGCPANNPNCNIVSIPTVDCTPPKLPYTAEETEQLKNLVARFYNIAAGLKTQADIQNEIDTRASYIELVNQAHTYTDQCVAQIKTAQKDIDLGKKASFEPPALDNNPRWNPYLSIKFLSTLPASKNAIAELNNQITGYTNQLELYDAQISLLKSMKNLNPAQTELLNIKIPERKALALKKKAEAKQKLADVQGGNGAGRKLLEGTFFPEKEKRDKTSNGNFVDIETGEITSDFKKASYLADYMVPSRLNDDWDRRNRLFFMIKDRINATSNFWCNCDGNNQPWAIFYFFQGTVESDINNPLQWLLTDRPRIIGQTDDDKNASGVKNFHRLQQLEDALGIW